MAALKIEPPASVKAIKKLADEGEAAMGAGRHDEASRKFLDVLERSKDPAARLGRPREAAHLAARGRAGERDAVSDAVMTEALGNKTEAKTLFLQLKEEHSSNPSVEAHLDRLP